MKKAVVCGAGGFIGSHLVKRLKQEGYYVIGVDLKYPEFSETGADKFYIHDLRNSCALEGILTHDTDELYQLAADMGGAGYIFTGENDAHIIHNSALINLNIAYKAVQVGLKKLFFSSSACVYPKENQLDPINPLCAEFSAFPANPDSVYGWEKLFSEIMYQSFQRNHGLDVRIARFHNIYGPEGVWNNGKEKAPAAICRKVAEANEEIEVWGDGEQTRSFLYIDECLEGVRRLMNAPVAYEPLNIGSEEMVTINQLVKIVARIAGKEIKVIHRAGPLGVRGRNSDNRLIEERLGWAPCYSLEKGLRKTYEWISKMIEECVNK